MDQFLVQLLEGDRVVRRMFAPINHRSCLTTLAQIALARLWQNDPFTETTPDSAAIYRLCARDQDGGRYDIEPYAIVDLDSDAVFDDLLSRQNRLFLLNYLMPPPSAHGRSRPSG